MLTLENVKKIKPNLVIKPEISYQPSYFFGNNRYDYIVDYDVKLSNGVSLQRDFVWTLHQKQELILSILKGIILPRFYVIIYTDDLKTSADKKKYFKIVDGKQRLSTIEGFMNNEFPIIWEGIEYFYSDFEDDLKRSIWGCDLRFSVVYEYPDTRISDNDLIKWFNLINWAGTPQDKEHIDNLLKLI